MILFGFLFDWLVAVIVFIVVVVQERATPGLMPDSALRAHS